MRVRAMTASGDSQFGQSGANFLVNSPAAVVQLVGTRLRLFVGEWFLDQTAGMPWMQSVIGKGTGGEYDAAIRGVILATTGVSGINSYESTFDAVTRTLTVTTDVQFASGIATSGGAATGPSQTAQFILDLSSLDIGVLT